MEKDKLVLADSTEIMIETSQGMSALTANVESKAVACSLWEKFTSDNLKDVTVKNADDLTIGKYLDMVLDHVTGADNADGTVQIIFSLRNKSVEELLMERVTALEAGQQTQDEAIGDLGQVVSDIAEGGVQ
ncbi:MAG: hypothetical protein HFI51_13735 [Lachnospiraceae bacterium]|jgi:hypothetical protein|nr:hypothetical protein [Lachnospiraceae bacterium]